LNTVKYQEGRLSIDEDAVIDELVTLIVDESKWLTVSLGLALVSVVLHLFQHRGSDLPTRRRVLAAMNLFFGVTIGTMAFGHLLAVTIKLALGTLEGSVATFYAIGAVLAVPSWWLIYHTRQILAPDDGRGRRTLVLNAWLALTLLALGLHNLPLAAPGFLNIAYQRHDRRGVGWTIVGTAVVINVGLLIGSLIFLASGQSFEQFRGIE
jgi:hypothetical protein